MGAAPPEPERTGPPTTLRRVVAVVARDRRLAGGVVAVTLALTLISAALPLAVAQGVSAGLRASTGEVYLLMGTVLGIGVAVWALNRMRSYLTRRLIARTVLVLRTDVLRTSFRSGLDFYGRFPRSAVASRATSDLEVFGETAFGLLELGQQYLVIAVLLPVMLVLDWRLTLVTLVCGAAIVLVARSFRRVTRPSAGAAAGALSRLDSLLSEAVTGLATVRAFGGQRLIGQEADRGNRAVRGATLLAERRAALLMPAVSVLVGIAVAGVVWAGGSLVESGAITLSAWYLFVLAADRISWTLTSVGAIEGMLQAALAAAGRVFELIDDGTAPTERPVGGPVADGASALVLEDVTLRYHSGVQALRGASLEVPPGCHMGLVGASGAGKSTLVKAAAGLHPVEGGRILLAGTSLEQWPETELRRAISYVPQRPQLFSGTLADNLRLVRPRATDAQLADVVAEAGLESWLAGLRAGLDTEVGPRGCRLSLGERQIIGVLRALVKRPGLVLLDEPTANVDAVTEAYLGSALRSLLGDTTCVTIAHRLETVRQCDRIAVMSHGRVAECGTHDELLAQRGEYAALHQDYLVGAVDAVL